MASAPIELVASNQNGLSKPFIPEPYSWKTYSDMNIWFFEKHQRTSYYEAKELLQKSHDQVIKLIETFSNDMLFAKKVFPWTGGSTLGSYCVSATSSHYDWAIKKIKLYMRSQK